MYLTAIYTVYTLKPKYRNMFTRLNTPYTYPLRTSPDTLNFLQNITS